MTPELITAVLAPLSVMVLAYFTYLTQRKVKEVHQVAEATLEKATATEHAVNGKDPGETSISQDVTTIKDKQEMDSPTELVVTKANGDASLRLQVAHLVKLVENLSGESAT